MFRDFIDRWRASSADVCFCTLAIHSPYRQRARLLLADAPKVRWIVLTDEPDDFAGLPVRAIHHAPTGPMAVDFMTRPRGTGGGRGAPAYHDKRFALQAALEESGTAIYIDADTRVRSLPKLPNFRGGIAVVDEINATIPEHLTRYGQHRLTVFEQLAVQLTGHETALASARWCSESIIAITKDGNESRFFDAWDRGAEFLQGRGVFTGEGGVIGLAAACAGWTIDYTSLRKLAASRRHEAGGPKS